MAKNGTKNGQKRVEAEQSSYYREYPVAFGQIREIVGVGQSDTANNALCRYCFQGTSVFAQEAPGTPVFGHCPSFISFDCCLLLPIWVFILLCVASVALALLFMPGLYPTAYRATFPAFFMRLSLVCFYCLCVFVCVFYFTATMSFAGYFLVRSLLYAFPAYLRFPV